jgi:hypothetical protein
VGGGPRELGIGRHGLGAGGGDDRRQAEGRREDGYQ